MYVAGARVNGFHTALAEQRSALLADERSEDPGMIAAIIRPAHLRGRRSFDGNWCDGSWRRRLVSVGFGQADTSDGRRRP